MNSNDQAFLNAVARDILTLISEGANKEDIKILISKDGDFMVLNMPDSEVLLDSIPLIISNTNFLEGHSGIISLNLSSI